MFDDITHFLSQLKVYALGKGLLTISVFVAGAVGAAFPAVGVLIPAIVAGAGGLALTLVRRSHAKGLYEDSMVNLYRDNIAEQLGIAPEDVTRASLREAAKDNEIIDQALKRQGKKSVLATCTAALAAVVSVGLIVAFGFDQTLQNMTSEMVSTTLAKFVGVGAVAGLSNAVIHEGLDALIGYKSGISKAAAHDLIYKMDLAVKRGVPISREEVFAVMVAGDHALNTRIIGKYGKEYRDMAQGEKSRVLHDFNLAVVMDKLAIAISEKKIRPGYLAYAADDPRLTTPRAAEQVETAIAPVSHNRTSFVERLGLGERTSGTRHSDLVTAQRDLALEAVAR